MGRFLAAKSIAVFNTPTTCRHPTTQYAQCITQTVPKTPWKVPCQQASQNPNLLARMFSQKIATGVTRPLHGSAAAAPPPITEVVNDPPPPQSPLACRCCFTSGSRPLHTSTTTAIPPTPIASPFHPLSATAAGAAALPPPPPLLLGQLICSQP